MRKKVLLIIAIIFSFLLASAPCMVSAGGCSSDSKNLSIPKKLLGVIKAADEKAGTVTVKSDNSYDPVIVKIDDKTTIKKDNENKTFKDIKAGDRVRLRYIETETGLVARTIALNPAEEGAKK